MKNKKKIVNVALIVVMLFTLCICAEFTFNKPTKLNKLIAGKFYSSPANSAFKDTNFYNCVIDSYNDSDDVDKVGYTTNLSDEQLQKITHLACQSRDIENTIGIEKMINLLQIDLTDNKIASIDVSKNAVLQDLYLSDNKISNINITKNTRLMNLSLSNNGLTNISLVNNTELEQLILDNNELETISTTNNSKLYYLDVTNNKLTNINVSNNTLLDLLMVEGNDLTSIDVSKLTQLSTLNISNNDISSLDVTKNTVLDVLDISKNYITTLDLSQNIYLFELIANNNYIEDIDLSKNVELFRLNISGNYLETIDLSANVELKKAILNNTALTTLDVSKNTNLDMLQANGNNLSTIDLSANTELLYLELNDNNLSSIDVSKNEYLYELSVSENNLTALNITSNTSLFDLNVSKNKLTTLNTKLNPDLRSLDASDNPDIVVDLSENTILETLKLRNNAHTDIDLSNNTLLSHLDLYGNGISEIDLTDNKELTYLDMSSNTLTTIDLSNNEKLQHLNLSDNSNIKSVNFEFNEALVYLSLEGLNKLTELDITNSPELLELYMYGSNIKEIDLSKQQKLQLLSIQSSGLETIDLSKNVSLDKIDLYGNNLTEIDLSKNIELTQLELYGNKIEIIDLSKNTKLDNTKTSIQADAVKELTMFDGFDTSKTENLLYGAKDIRKVVLGNGLEIIPSDTYTYDYSSAIIIPKETSKDEFVNLLGVKNLSVVIYDSQYNVVTPETITDGHIIEIKDGEKVVDSNIKVQVFNDYNGFNDPALYKSVIDAYNEEVQKLLDSMTEEEKQNSDLKKLKYIETITDSQLNMIKKLDCGETGASITDTTGLEKLISLEVLSIEDSQLSSIDLSKNTVLKQLTLTNSNITELDISKNDLLTHLYLDGVKLSEIDLSKNTKLTNIVVVNSLLTEIDVTKNIELLYLDVSNNNIEELDLSKNTNLLGLGANNNSLMEIDLENNTKLEELQLEDNLIEKLDLSKLTGLKGLRVNNNSFVEENSAYVNTVVNVASNLKLIKYPENANVTIEFVSSTSSNADYSNKVEFTPTAIGDVELEIELKISGLDYQSGNLYTEYEGDNTYSGKYYLYVVELKSSKYYINNEKEYIFTGTNSDLDSIISDLELDFGIIDKSDNKISVLDINETLMKTFDIKTIKYINQSTTSSYDTIVVEDIEYDELEDAIEISEDLTFKIYREGTEVTSGSIENGDVIKVYDEVEEISEISIEVFNNNSGFEDPALYRCVVDAYNNENSADIKYSEELTDEQLEKIEALDCSSVSSDIYDTTGIEALTNLKQLNLSNSNITEIDLSKNTELTLLNLSGSDLTAINLDSNTKLESLDLSNNKLTEIDLSKNEELLTIELGTNNFSYDVVVPLNKTLDINHDLGFITLPTNLENTTLVSTTEKESTASSTLEDGILTMTSAGKYELEATYSLDDYNNSKYTGTYNITVMEVTSKTYKIVDNYIYTNTDTETDTIKNNIETTLGEIQIEDNKVKVIYNEKTLVEYDILNISLGNLTESNNIITLKEDMTYDDLTDEITVPTGVSYKIFDSENNEVTTGNLEEGMTLKIYVDKEVVDEYTISNEFLDMSKFTIDESLKIIDKVVAGTTIEEFKNDILTSGTVSIVNDEGTTLTDTDLISTGSIVTVRLTNSTYTYTVTVLGDVSGDGYVEIGDISLAYRAMKKKVTLDTCYQLAADVVERDNEVNIGEISMMYRYFKGRLPNGFEVIE